MLCSEPLWAPLWSWSENNWRTIVRRNTKILLYYQGSSTEGSARATTADEAHLFQKDQATTHKVCIVTLACQGYSFSSVWTPPTIFKTRLALPHLGRNINTDFAKDHPTRCKLLHCAGNLPAVCGRHSGSTCGLCSCSWAGACTVAIVPTDVVSRTFLSAGYPKRKDRDFIRLMNTYHLFGCCTMELSSHSKRLAVIAIFLDLY